MPGSERLLVVGQGYVGLALARERAGRGSDVTGFDTNVAHATSLALAVSYSVVHDPADVPPFDVAVIAVPTLLVEGEPDMENLRQAAQLVGSRLTAGALVVVESTVYPGATRQVVAAGLEEASGLRAGADFALGYSPERLDPGPSSPGLADVPRVVGGIDADSLRRTREFYDSMVPHTIPVSSIEVAELSKLIENTFRHVNVALVNELALAEAALGVDVREAIDAAASKPYGFMKFTPSAGVGGDCIPVSPRYLNWAVTAGGGSALRFVELANAIDQESSAHVVDHACSILAQRGTSLEGSRVLLVGLAYKKDVPEVRNSAALRIGQLLQDRGALISAADPLIPRRAWPVGLDRAEICPCAVANSDIALVLVAHSGVDLRAVTASNVPVLDTSRTLHAKNVIPC